MRLSISNEGISHEFSRGSECNTDVYSGNMSLRNIENICNYIYSYSTAIAKYDIKKDTFVISMRTYSNTTSKHQSTLRRALSGYNTVFIYDVNDSNKTSLNNYFDDLKEFSIKQLRARKRDYIANIVDTIVNLKNFINYINLDKRSKEYKRFIKIENSNDKVSTILELNKKEILDNEKANKARLKTQNEAKKAVIKTLLEKDFKTFLNDRQIAFNNNDKFLEINRKYKNYFDNIKRLELKELYYVLNYKDLLKVTDKENVITSQGVIISNKDAKRLYLAIIGNSINVGDIVLDWYCNEVTEDHIIIGCHTIAIEDIKNCYEGLIL